MSQRNFIFIENAEFRAFHGVLPQERTVGNIFLVNIQIEVNFHEATLSDNLNHTISYAEVFDIIRHEMSTVSQLIEHVGGRIIQSLLLRFPQIISIDLSITKKHPPLNGQTSGAGVRILHTSQIPKV